MSDKLDRGPSRLGDDWRPAYDRACDLLRQLLVRYEADAGHSDDPATQRLLEACHHEVKEIER